MSDGIFHDLFGLISVIHPESCTFLWYCYYQKSTVSYHWDKPLCTNSKILCLYLSLVSTRCVRKLGHNSKILYQVSAFRCDSTYWQRPKLLKKLLFVDLFEVKLGIYDFEFGKKISEFVILGFIIQGKAEVIRIKYNVKVKNAMCNFGNHIRDFVFLSMKDSQAFDFDFVDFYFFPSDYCVYFVMPVITSFTYCRCQFLGVSINISFLNWDIICDLLVSW